MLLETKQIGKYCIISIGLVLINLLKFLVVSCIDVVFAVSLIIRYGYFEEREVVLGPNSSRLFKINPFFVEQIIAKSEAGSEARLFGLSQKPELSLETNWSFSRYLFLGPYRNQVSLSLFIYFLLFNLVSMSMQLIFSVSNIVFSTNFDLWLICITSRLISTTAVN